MKRAKPASRSNGGKKSEQDLFRAAETGDVAMVKLLLEQGADPNTTIRNGYIENYSLLMAAAAAESAESVRVLLAAGANPSLKTDSESGGAGDNTALHIVLLPADISAPRLEIIQALLDAGADSDAQSNNGCTPLYYAAAAGWLEAVELMVEAGARSHLQDGARRSPLHAAAGKGYNELMRRILEMGASVNQRDDEGRTPLMSAVYGQPETVAMLLESGADPHAVAQDGKTVFIHAALYARDAEDDDIDTATGILQQLLEVGVDTRLKDCEGRTGLGYAEDAYEPEIVLYLKSNGVTV